VRLRRRRIWRLAGAWFEAAAERGRLQPLPRSTFTTPGRKPWPGDGTSGSARPALRHPSVPFRHRRAARRETGRRSGEPATGDHRLGQERAWPRSSTSRRCSISPALADGAYPGPVRQFPVRNVLFASGPGARAYRRARSWIAAMRQLNASRLDAHRCRHDRRLPSILVQGSDHKRRSLFHKEIFP